MGVAARRIPKLLDNYIFGCLFDMPRSSRCYTIGDREKQGFEAFRVSPFLSVNDAVKPPPRWIHHNLSFSNYV